MSADTLDVSIRSMETDIKILKATSATKEDLAKAIGDVRSEMHKEFAAQTTRFIGWVFVLAALAVSAIKYLP